MKSENYEKCVLTTESSNFNEIGKRMDKTRLRMLHAAIGISTEAGELLDQLKKNIYYGKDLDVTNLIEELGDLFWYATIMINELGISFEKVFDINIAKLRKRYSNGFSQEEAINRSIESERKILEEN